MIIMAVDLGDVRTGIAVCDKNEVLASPLGIIEEKNTENLAKKICEKISETKAELIVIGLPKNMDGSLGESAKKSMKFKEILNDMTETPSVLWDERRTTISAHLYLNETNTRGKRRKSIIDALSASIILESYLAYRKNNLNV